MQKRLEKLMGMKKSDIDTDTETCLICMDSKPDSIFHPCGHGGFCFSCATSIVETNAICHYCRKVRKNLNFFFNFFRI